MTDRGFEGRSDTKAGQRRGGTGPCLRAGGPRACTRTETWLEGGAVWRAWPRLLCSAGSGPPTSRSSRRARETRTLASSRTSRSTKDPRLLARAPTRGCGAPWGASWTAMAPPPPIRWPGYSMTCQPRRCPSRSRSCRPQPLLPGLRDGTRVAQVRGSASRLSGATSPQRRERRLGAWPPRPAAGGTEATGLALAIGETLMGPPCSRARRRPTATNRCITRPTNRSTCLLGREQGGVVVVRGPRGAAATKGAAGT
mmetsp:Transcript_11081/g.26283  ORF Transcript_11081/g.26283 Transcript_11081/m.26283 type:complete len:255 (+) Transcript_11081:561-1325(+)